MFGFNKIEVFPVSFHNGHITFRTPKKIGVGKSVKVKLLLAGQDSPTVSLKITEMDENLDDYTGVGLLKERQKKLDALLYQMALAGVEGACRRATKRVPATIRLRSRQLPNYRGITANVNETGVEINTDGPLPVGTPVTLEFDVPEMSDLSMSAVSIWSSDGPVIGKGTYRAGVEFTETDAQTLDAWSSFYRRMVESEGASVMMKSMGDGGETGTNYNTRESGRQTTVLESDKVKDETETPAQTPPAPPFQPPSAPSTPAFLPPSNTPGFQPPGGAPAFQAPTQPTPPTFPSSPPASQPPLFQAPSIPRFDTPSTPSFPGATTSSSPPAFQPPQAPPGPPSFSPPGSSGLPSFSPPGQPPPFGSPSAPKFDTPPAPSNPPSPPFGGPNTPKPPQSLRLDTDSPPKPPLSTSFQPSGSIPQFQAPKPPSAPPPTFGQPTTPSFGQPSSPSFGPPPGPSFGPPPGPSFGPPPGPSFGPPPGPSFGPPPGPPFGQPPGPSFGPPPGPSVGQTSNAQFGAGSSPSGFQPSPHGFQPPAAPERVTPVKMSGAHIMFRCREGHRYQSGSQAQVELAFQFQGQTNSVVVKVQVSGLQPEQDGTFTCLGLVQEDAQKIQVLNQVIGS